VRYKVKNTAALHLALGSLPDRMRVDADSGIGVSARTVGDLRKATIWLENLALLWQIYSRRFLLPIHFRQCGHRFGGS
jgi:hypothetical protein